MESRTENKRPWTQNYRTQNPITLEPRTFALTEMHSASYSILNPSAPHSNTFSDRTFGRPFFLWAVQASPRSCDAIHTCPLRPFTLDSHLPPHPISARSLTHFHAHGRHTRHVCGKGEFLNHLAWSPSSSLGGGIWSPEREYIFPMVTQCFWEISEKTLVLLILSLELLLCPRLSLKN